MAKLNLRAVEERTSKLGGRAEYDREFLFDLLEAYGRAKSSITRLRSGNLDVAQDPSREVAQKNVVYFHESESGQAFDDFVRLSTAAHVIPRCARSQKNSGSIARLWDTGTSNSAPTCLRMMMHRHP